MSVITDTSIQKARPPIMIMPFVNSTTQRSNKKKKKGRKLKFKRQFASLSSIIQIENQENLDVNTSELSLNDIENEFSNLHVRQNNNISRKLPQCEKPPTTKLPVLPKSSKPIPTYRTGSSPGYRLPVTLPASLQPGAHERRKKVPLLSAIKPENEKSERDRFIRANFNYNPMFIYRFPAEPDVLERLGQPSDKYMKQAILIMENAINNYGTYERFEEITGGKFVQRPQILSMIQRYLKRDDMEGEIMINMSEELLSRGSMTRVKGNPTLNIRVVNLREFWVEGLMRHEIGTHYIRSMNNKAQDWCNWKIRAEMGLKPANPTEEGLASLHSVLLRKDPCLWRAALLYYVAYQAAFLSLKELFLDLGQFVVDPIVRWDYCIRAKRGQQDTSHPGGFCKDQVYLDGALQILKQRKNIDFHNLMRFGKISYEDINKLLLLGHVENTRIPYFMQDIDSYLKNLDKIAEANALTDKVLMDV